jgi:hypothetical protein
MPCLPEKSRAKVWPALENIVTAASRKATGGAWRADCKPVPSIAEVIQNRNEPGNAGATTTQKQGVRL